MQIVIGRFQTALEKFLTTEMPCEKRVEVTDRIPLALLYSAILQVQESEEVIQAS